jgi:branched-chain amino acid transport system substrate-binding protein
MKMTALTDTMAKEKSLKKVYLINQDYSFGKAVAAAARAMLAKKRPTSRSWATSCTRCRR